MSSTRSSTITLDDRKGTGFVSATVKGVRGDDVDFAVCIVGPENGMDVVYTFHPGDPVNPSRVPAKDMDGKAVTVREVIEMGLDTVQITA